MKYFLIFFIIISIFISGFNTHYAIAEDLSEKDLFEKVNVHLAKNETQRAISLLEDFLNKSPDTKNESIYIRLGNIYDDDLNDFEKALEIYSRYLKAFPEGNYKNFCQKRVDYFEDHRSEWEAIRQYRCYIQESCENEADLNIKNYENFIKTFPDTSVTIDVYYRLTEEYMNNNEPESAVKYIEMYIDNFRDIVDLIKKKEKVFLLYADILNELNMPFKALSVLDKAVELSSTLKNEGADYIDLSLYNTRIKEIKKKIRVRRFYIFGLSFAFIALLFILVIYLKRKMGYKKKE